MSPVPQRLFAIGGLLALSAVLMSCGAAAPASGGAPGGDAVTVVATDLAFQPKEVRVPANQRVTIRLQNKGKVLHDWTVAQIPVSAVEARGSASHSMGSGGNMMGGGMMSGNAGASQLHIAAGAGRTADVTFTPGQAGEFVFYCTVPGHREAGMEGRLIVG